MRSASERRVHRLIHKSIRLWRDTCGTIMLTTSLVRHLVNVELHKYSHN